MKLPGVRRTALIALLLVAPIMLAAGDKKKDKDAQFCSLSFVIVRDSSGKPIKNASVIVHALLKDGTENLKDGFQLKTDVDGRASIDDIPYGKLRLQVIAHNFQTYGDDIEINQPKQEFTLRLKPPAEQYSIYK